MRNANEFDQEKATVATVNEKRATAKAAYANAKAAGTADADAIDAIIAERGCNLDEAIAIFIESEDE